MDPEQFLQALIGVPRLPGALCKGLHELFDQQVGNDRQEAEQTALSLCRRCPALASCEAWFEGLPANMRPGGVWNVLEESVVGTSLRLSICIRSPTRSP